jgi:hypothetical protein
MQKRYHHLRILPNEAKASSQNKCKTIILNGRFSSPLAKLSPGGPIGTQGHETEAIT